MRPQTGAAIPADGKEQTGVRRPIPMRMALRPDPA